jgi:hypothetical protein
MASALSTKVDLILVANLRSIFNLFVYVDFEADSTGSGTSMQRKLIN